jgi:hypothetical protein
MTREGINYGKRSLSTGKMEIDQSADLWIELANSTLEDATRQLNMGNQPKKIPELISIVNDNIRPSWQTAYERYIMIEAIGTAFVKMYVKPGRAPAWH